MHKKSCVAILGLLVLVASFNPIIGFAMVTEPEPELWGSLTKSVTNLDNLFEFIDDEGKLKDLEYSIQDNKNISFSVYDIDYANQWHNKSIAKANTTGTNSELIAQGDLLVDTNGVNYILLQAVNATALTVDTNYVALWKLEVNSTVNPNMYLLGTVKRLLWTEIDGTAEWSFLQDFVFLDEGAEDHVVRYTYKNGTESYSTFKYDYDGDGKADDLSVTIQNVDPILSMQLKLSDISDELGVDFVKMTSLKWSVQFKTHATTLVSSYEFKWASRVFYVYDNKVKVCGELVNTTKTIELETSAITSTVDINGIGSVILPYEYSIPADKTYNDDKNLVRYNYGFLLTSDPAISYSTAKLNFTVPSGTIDDIDLNEVDKSSKVANKNVGDVVLLESALIAGTQYVLGVDVIYTDDEYYDLAMGISIAWYTPAGLVDKLLGLLIAFLNVLGFSGARLRKMRAKVRTPK